MTIFAEGRRSVMKDAESAAIIRTGKSNTWFGAGQPAHARTAAEPTATAANTPDNDRLADCVRRPAARFDTMTLAYVGSKGRSRSLLYPQHAVARSLTRTRGDHTSAAGLFRSDTARSHNGLGSFEFLVSLEKLLCERPVSQARNGTRVCFSGTGHARGTAWMCRRVIGSRRAFPPLDTLCPRRVLLEEARRSLAVPRR